MMNLTITTFLYLKLQWDHFDMAKSSIIGLSYCESEHIADICTKKPALFQFINFCGNNDVGMYEI